MVIYGNRTCELNVFAGFVLRREGQTTIVLLPGSLPSSAAIRSQNVSMREWLSAEFPRRVFAQCYDAAMHSPLSPDPRKKTQSKAAMFEFRFPAVSKLISSKQVRAICR